MPAIRATPDETCNFLRRACHGPRRLCQASPASSCRHVEQACAGATPAHSFPAVGHGVLLCPVCSYRILKLLLLHSEALRAPLHTEVGPRFLARPCSAASRRFREAVSATRRVFLGREPSRTPASTPAAALRFYGRFGDTLISTTWRQQTTVEHITQGHYHQDEKND